MHSSPRRIALGGAFFFLSGLLGLGYEILWIRKAALVVGSSQIALATVLAAFFLGLGVGARVAGGLPRGRVGSPLLLYGLFETAIGVLAVAFPSLFDVVERVYGAAYPLAASSAPALLALRFSLVFLLFLPPTFLMGATLPLLLEGLTEDDRAIGSRTGLLYGLNVLGAAAGAILTAYLAIPQFGLDGTSRLGGAANIALGMIAWLAFRGTGLVRGPDERPAGPLERFFPIASFASGFLAIGYQVAWARYLSLFRLTTVHWTAMLVAVNLLAAAAGSLALALILRRVRKPLTLLAWAQALAPAAALATIELWRLADYRYAVAGMVTETGQVTASPTLEIETSFTHPWRLADEAIDGVLLAPFFQVSLAIFLPAALLGIGLPALIAAGARTSVGLRGDAGRIFFWNTLGASAGGFAAGYALLPALGLHWTLFALGLGSFGLAAAAGRKIPSMDRAEVSVLGIGFAAGLIVFLVLTLAREDITRRTIARHGLGPGVGLSAPPGPGAPRPARARLVDVREGPFDTSFVIEDDASLRIASGSVSMGLAFKEAPSPQAIQGHLPCLFYPGRGAPEACLGICLGSGQSFGALLLHPIRRLDVVEISREALDLSLRHFAAYQHGLGQDPRVAFHLDDGRHFASRSPSSSYDLVSLEPPPPAAEGVSSLYTIEFLREVSRILRPGGVFMQWLPLHQVTPSDLRAILRTQAEVFPETFAVKTGEEELMALGFPRPPTFAIKAIRERLKIFERERHLSGRRWNASCRRDLATVEGVLALIIMGPEEVRGISGVILRDDRQLLAHSTGDRWLWRRYQGTFLAGLCFAALPLAGFEGLAGRFEPPLEPETASELARERARSLENFGVSDPEALAAKRKEFEEAQTAAAKQAAAVELASLFDRSLAKEEAFDWIERAAAAVPSGGKPEHSALVRSVVRNRLAAYADLTARRARAIAAAWPSSPLARAMMEELRGFEAREDERLGGYLFR